MPKLWTKPYVLTLCSVFTLSITMTIFMPLIPIYIKQIGADATLTGLIVSVYTFSALLFRPLFAVLIDKYDRKPFLVFGLVLILAACFSYRFAVAIGVLIMLRVVHGVGYGAASNSASTIIADIVPPQRRGQGIGYFGFVTAASLALGPAIGLLITHAFDIKTAFLCAAVIAAMGLIASGFISYSKPAAPAGQMKPRQHGGYEKSALPAALVMLLVAFAYSSVMTYLPAYAASIGIESISSFFVVYAVVLLLTRLCVDRITKNREISVVLIPGIIMMAGTYIMLGTVRTMPSFLLAAVLFAIGFGAVQPTLNAVVISACPVYKRGAANSTFFSAMDVGIGLGALIWGLVANKISYPAVYFGCLAFMALAVAAVVYMRKKTPRQAIQE